MLASMSASSPHVFSRFVCPEDDPIINIENTMVDSFLDFSNISSQSKPDSNPKSPGDPKSAKKLIHNANERHRRQRVNNTYFHLRSLLPGTLHRTKKMSIPATVTYTLKYIPELQKLVKGLIREKEELLLRIKMQGNDETEQKREALGLGGSVNISGSQIGNREIMVQISTYEASICSVLLILEQHGLILLHASSFRSSCGMLLSNLYFKVGEGSRLMECELLSNKLKSLLDETIIVPCC